jgi:hypothetical protein
MATILEVHTTIHLQTDDGLQIEKYNPDDPFHSPGLPIFYSGYFKCENRWEWLFDASLPKVARGAIAGIAAEVFDNATIVDNIEEVFIDKER